MSAARLVCWASLLSMMMTIVMMTTSTTTTLAAINHDDDVNTDCNAKQVSPLGQDAVQLKVEDETESHAWFVQPYDDYLIATILS